MLIKLETKSERVKGLSFHPFRSWILASLHTGTIQLWDYRTSIILEKFQEHDGPVRSVAFHNQQPLFVSGGDDYKVKVWNYKQKKSMFTLSGHSDYVRTTVFHAEYPWIASASDDQTIRIWNWQSRSSICILAGHNHYVMSASFHPTADLLLSAALDQTVRVWDISGLKKAYKEGINLFTQGCGVLKYLLEGHTRGVNWACFHPNMRLIASGGDDHQVKLWRFDDDKAWEVCSYLGHHKNVSSVVFHKKEDLLVSNGEDRSVKVWDMMSKTCMYTYRRERDRFWILTTHPSLNLFAAGHDSGMLIFKLERERPIFSLITNSLYYVKEKSIRKYDFTTGKDVPITLVNNISWNNPVRSISINPEESSILIAVESREGNYYELREVAKIEAHNRRYPGKNARWISNTEFAVVERNHQLSIRNLHNQVVTSLPGISYDNSFNCPKPNIIALRNQDFVTLIKTQDLVVLAKIKIKRCKLMIWSPRHKRVALINKHQIHTCDAGLRKLALIKERMKIKSGAWDGENVFVYTTTHHIKYTLITGETGVIRTIDVPIYIISVCNGKIHCLDRDCCVKIFQIDTTEYTFKLALMKRDFAKVINVIRNHKLVGQSIISYLNQNGFTDIALHFVKDHATNFELALKCGNLEIALKSAFAVNERVTWIRLADAALQLGDIGVAEISYKQADCFDKLLFLYLITGNLEKLRNLGKQCGTSKKYHIALLLGDIEGRVLMLSEANKYQLAYLTAVTHGFFKGASSKNVDGVGVVREVESLKENVGRSMHQADDFEDICEDGPSEYISHKKISTITLASAQVVTNGKGDDFEDITSRNFKDIVRTTLKGDDFEDRTRVAQDYLVAPIISDSQEVDSRALVTIIEDNRSRSQEMVEGNVMKCAHRKSITSQALLRSHAGTEIDSAATVFQKFAENPKNLQLSPISHQCFTEITAPVPSSDVNYKEETPVKILRNVKDSTYIQVPMINQDPNAFGYDPQEFHQHFGNTSKDDQNPLERRILENALELKNYGTNITDSKEKVICSIELSRIVGFQASNGGDISSEATGGLGDIEAIVESSRFKGSSWNRKPIHQESSFHTRVEERASSIAIPREEKNIERGHNVSQKIHDKLIRPSTYACNREDILSVAFDKVVGVEKNVASATPESSWKTKQIHRESSTLEQDLANTFPKEVDNIQTTNNVFQELPDRVVCVRAGASCEKESPSIVSDVIVKTEEIMSKFQSSSWSKRQILQDPSTEEQVEETALELHRVTENTQSSHNVSEDLTDKVISICNPAATFAPCFHQTKSLSNTIEDTSAGTSRFAGDAINSEASQQNVDTSSNVDVESLVAAYESGLHQVAETENKNNPRPFMARGKVKGGFSVNEKTTKSNIASPLLQRVEHADKSGMFMDSGTLQSDRESGDLNEDLKYHHKTLVNIEETASEVSTDHGGFKELPNKTAALKSSHQLDSPQKRMGNASAGRCISSRPMQHILDNKEIGNLKNTTPEDCKCGGYEKFGKFSDSQTSNKFRDENLEKFIQFDTWQSITSEINTMTRTLKVPLEHTTRILEAEAFAISKLKAKEYQLELIMGSMKPKFLRPPPPIQQTCTNWPLLNKHGGCFEKNFGNGDNLLDITATEESGEREIQFDNNPDGEDGSVCNDWTLREDIPKIGSAHISRNTPTTTSSIKLEPSLLTNASDRQTKTALPIVNNVEDVVTISEDMIASALKNFSTDIHSSSNISCLPKPGICADLDLKVPGYHARLGNYEISFDLLNTQAGVVNFNPYRRLFQEMYGCLRFAQSWQNMNPRFIGFNYSLVNLKPSKGNTNQESEILAWKTSTEVEISQEDHRVRISDKSFGSEINLDDQMKTSPGHYLKHATENLSSQKLQEDLKLYNSSDLQLESQLSPRSDSESELSLRLESKLPSKNFSEPKLSYKPDISSQTLLDKEFLPTMDGHEMQSKRSPLDNVERSTTLPKSHISFDYNSKSKDSPSEFEKNVQFNTSSNQHIESYDNHFRSGTCPESKNRLESQISSKKYLESPMTSGRALISSIPCQQQLGFQYAPQYNRVSATFPPTVHDLIKKLQTAYQSTTNGNFEPAILEFQNLILHLSLMVIINREEVIIADDLLKISSEYTLALKMEVHRRSLAKSTPDDQKRQCELAAYFTHSKLLTAHQICTLRLAMNVCFKAKNYKSALRFADRLLKLGVGDALAAQVNKMVLVCQQDCADAIDLDYDEFNPFVLCGHTFKPIYKGFAVVRCCLCGCTYFPEFRGYVCNVCNVSEIGFEGSGLKVSVC